MRTLITMGLLGLMGLTGCADGPPYFYGERITGQTFVPLDDAVGVHPSQTVLVDPNNPFAKTLPGAETRWEIESYGDPVAAFYSWASLLSVIATGEHQFYAALNLSRIFNEGRASDEDLPRVRDLAIAGFQAVLDEFPGSVTFNNLGTVSFGLATPAYLGIVDLGGAPSGGWQLLTDPNGNPVAVKTSDPPPPAQEDE